MWRPCQGGSQVARLNFKTSRVGVYKCLSLLVGFVVTVAIWPGEVASCHDFILCAVATFWAMWLVGIYPGRACMWKIKGNRSITLDNSVSPRICKLINHPYNIYGTCIDYWKVSERSNKAIL